MSVHPFARRCDEIIAHLRDILANLRRAKKTVKEKEPKKRKGGGLSFFDLPRLMLLGSPQMENQAMAYGSERGLNQNYDKSQGKKGKPIIHSSGDPQRDRLRQRYIDAMDKCRRKNLEENEAFYRCLAKAGKEGTSNKHCKSQFVPMRCPEGVAAREALDAYEKNKGARTGDGKGGGW